MTAEQKPKVNEYFRIPVYVVSKDEEITNHLKSLNPSFFEVSQFDDIEDAFSNANSSTVIVVEKSLFNRKKGQGEYPVIVVTNNELNIKDDTINRIPKELFDTPYLQEFIYWSIEKTKRILSERKKHRKKQEIEKIITDLQTISRCSLFKSLS